MTQTEKNCTNCYWHNNGCPSTGEVCNGLSMWKPKACDYWNGEECTFDHSACDSQVESQLSQKEKELGEYKEALRLALNCFDCNDCIYDDACPYPRTVDSCFELFLTKAKGG